MLTPLRLVALASAVACLLCPGAAAPLRAEAPALPAYRHPGAGQIFYFVLTDRFANGDPANDRAGLTGDREVHGFDPAGKGWYHGGDFAGLTARLDYIQGLGATALWITPPFRNNYVQKGSAGYHGYWIVDFLRVDPHLGTESDLRRLIDEAHRRGLRVFLDIVINHTGDIIAYSDGNYAYRPEAEKPYRDASGNPFSPAAVAANGTRQADFPALDPARSFAAEPVLPPGREKIKNPSWLNNPAYYHNRGDSTFRGPSSLDGDFVGLDDVMTEHPDVVRGLADLYAYWMREYKIDGYRIDTVRHVNQEFWQAFCASLRETARTLGRPDFFHFGEAMSAHAKFLADFNVETSMDATLDFALWKTVRQFFSQGLDATLVDRLWTEDDRQVRPLGDAHLQTTFIGNHDDGRFLYFVRTDQPQASRETWLALSRLGHAFLLLARGQPVLYYGEEQGMNAMGNDQMSREDMFPSLSPEYRDIALVGSTRTGADEKFDPTHPLYRMIAELSALRKNHAALREGSTRAIATGHSAVAGFCRVHRRDLHPYFVFFNRGATPADVSWATGLPPRTSLRPLAGDLTSSVASGTEGQATITLPPFAFTVLRSEQPAAVRSAPLQARFHSPAENGTLSLGTTETDGLVFPDRIEFGVTVEGSDDIGEVTFTATRSSRPGQVELLGVDDAPPYRLFWRPNPDWKDDDTLVVTALYRDLRGREVSASSEPLRVKTGSARGGVRGASTPTLVSFALDGPTSPRTLTALAQGSGPLFYTWYREDEALAETGPILRLPDEGAAGRYRVVVHNQAGAVISHLIEVPAATAQ